MRPAPTRSAARVLLVCAWLAITLAAPAAAETVLVQGGSRMTWIANVSDPGVALAWTQLGFDAAAWAEGVYGVGYETGIGAAALLATSVPRGSASVYTRATFSIQDLASVQNFYFGAYYDYYCRAVPRWLPRLRAAVPKRRGKPS